MVSAARPRHLVGLPAAASACIERKSTFRPCSPGQRLDLGGRKRRHLGRLLHGLRSRYIDLEQRTLQPLDNPFGTRLLHSCVRYKPSPMSWTKLNKATPAGSELTPLAHRNRAPGRARSRASPHFCRSALVVARQDPRAGPRDPTALPGSKTVRDERSRRFAPPERSRPRAGPPGYLRPSPRKGSPRCRATCQRSSPKGSSRNCRSTRTSYVVATRRSPGSSWRSTRPSKSLQVQRDLWRGQRGRRALVGTVRHRLGATDELTLEQARLQGRGRHPPIKLGIDFNQALAAQKAEERTVDILFEEYAADMRKREALSARSPATLDRRQRYVGDWPAPAVDRCSPARWCAPSTRS